MTSNLNLFRGADTEHGAESVVGAPARRSTSASALGTSNLAPVAALDMGTEAFAIAPRGSLATPPSSTPSSTGGQTVGGDMLVMRPVAELAWDDVVFDRHGRRRIIEITRDYGRAYLEFSTGPSNWYMNREELAVEVLS